jgi:hypothetical protein
MPKAFASKIVRTGLIVPSETGATAARRDGTGSPFKPEFETALGTTLGVKYLEPSGLAPVLAS